MIFPRGPSANSPTTPWRGWQNRRQFIGLRDATGDVAPSDAPAAAAAAGISAVVGRRRNRARCYRQWRRWLHFAGFECRAGSVPGDLHELPTGADADREISANRLAPLTAAAPKESPAALKYALCLLGFMSPNTRLPIVELVDAAKPRSQARSPEIGDEDLACPIESWHVRCFPKGSAATS